ncbi:MAG: adenylate/guanylate cyclase domain-containing protein [Spirochaetota bacterium]
MFRSDINAFVDKATLMANATSGSEVTPEKTLSLRNLFFKEDKNFVYLGVFQEQGQYLKAINRNFNETYLLENQLEESDVERLVYLHARTLQKAFGGEMVLHNVSQGFPFPIIAISVPYLDIEGVRSILVALVRVEKLINAFNIPGIVKAFMVNGKGIVITHPNEKLILSAANLEDSPIVDRMVRSKVDNGQTQYSDKQGNIYLGSFNRIGLAGAGIITYVLREKALEEVYNIQRRNLIILGIALSSAILIVLYFARTITTPVLKLVEASSQIEKGVFNVDIQPAANDEIGLLTNSFIQMGLGLEEREKVKSILGSMIDPIVVKEAMNDMAALKRGKETTITAFFSDVAGFSTISEKLTSSELAALLNEYLSAMTIILKEYDGVLDKYIGDAIVGIFNAPVDVNGHCLQAAKASVRMMERLEDLRAYWTANNSYCPEAQMMDIRIGLNTGLAKVGFMGTDDLASYTMMGDTVNLAARLEAAAKDYGVNILVSESLKNKVEEEIFCRQLDLVRVKGKDEPVRVYEIVSEMANVQENISQAGHLYEEGLRFYLMRNWNMAIQKLQESERARGSKDKAVRLLVERCETYAKNPPPDSWDGVFTRTHK